MRFFVISVVAMWLIPAVAFENNPTQRYSCTSNGVKAMTVYLTTGPMPDISMPGVFISKLNVNSRKGKGWTFSGAADLAETFCAGDCGESYFTFYLESKLANSSLLVMINKLNSATGKYTTDFFRTWFNCSPM